MIREYSDQGDTLAIQEAGPMDEIELVLDSQQVTENQRI